MFIGLAFNERNDAFDFNTALEDNRREKDLDRKAALLDSSVTNNASSGLSYKMKEGEKIRVSIPKAPSLGDDTSTSPTNNSPTNDSPTNNSPQQQHQQQHQQQSVSAKRREARSKSNAGNTASGGFLKPSTKDTPSRLA